MKKIGLLLSIFALVLPSFPALAADNVAVSIGVDNQNDNVYESEIKKVNWIGVKNGLPYMDGNQKCESFSDAECLSSNPVGIVATTVLPLCDSDAQTNCLLPLRIGTPGGKKLEASFLGNADGATFPADPKNGTLMGSTSSIFSVNDKDNVKRHFAVTAQVKQLKARKLPVGYRDVQIPYFSVDIKEINLNSEGQCLFLFKDSCVTHKTSGAFSAEVKVRLSNDPPKWLAGRVADPSVKFNKLGQGKEVVISGTSVAVPLIEGNVPTSIFAKYPRGITSDTVKTAAQSGTKLEIDSGLAIMYASDVFTALKEKSTKVVNLWNVNGSSPFTAFCAEDLQVDCLQGGNGPCVEQSKEFVGLLATNALIFNRNPPRLIDDEIQFLLASPHLLPDSKATVGNFNLVASSSMLRCIYGLPDLPLFAEISVVNESGVEKIATKSFSEKNGISYISINNFSYSVPKIKIKLYQSKKRSTINCVKGKVKKSVTGVRPVCPPGYKRAG
jgi:hypothetical protein